MLCVKAKKKKNQTNLSPSRFSCTGKAFISKKMLVWIRGVQHLEMFSVFCDGLVYVQLP